MNSNNIPEKMGPMGPNQPQQPQQQGANKNAPMLPPQLANLTPQQLQQLRSQPQFQALMKNYLQRQQMMQQQQKLGKQPMVPNQAPGLAPRPQGNFQAVNYGNAQGMNPQQRNFAPQNTNLMAGMNPQLSKVAPAQGRVNSQISAPNAAIAPGTLPPHAIAQQKLASQENQSRELRNSSQMNNDLASRLPIRDLVSLNEWSDKIVKEGKEIPSDVKIYETLIKKDFQFTRKYSQHLNENKEFLDKLIRDIKAYTEVKQLRMNAISLSAKGQFNNSIWGEGYQGYGNGLSNTATRLILPHQNKRLSAIPDVAFTEREINEKVLQRLEKGERRNLVPIRLEFDLERDRFKLRDTFLWDFDEDVFPLENFVALLIEDYKFISPQHGDAILSAIKDQIRDFHKSPSKPMGELRIPIKIDVTMNNTQLVDQFEWDILNYEDDDPEAFATIMCDELNLPGEFTTAVAHSIREQAQLFHKSLYMVGYSFDGSRVQEDEIRSHLLPALRTYPQESLGDTLHDASNGFYSILRNPNNLPSYTPSLMKLTQLELERLDKEIERDARRKRRHILNDVYEGGPSTSGASASGGRGLSRRGALHTARGGPVLPDLSDTPKTFRTPASSSILPGGIDLGVPDVYGYNEVLVQRSQVKNTDYRPPPQKQTYDDEAQKTVLRNRVRYDNDQEAGTFVVKISYLR